MTKEGNFSSTKRLLIVLGVVLLLAVIVGIWLYFSGRPISFWPTKTTLTNENPVVVRELSSNEEKSIGTIIYAAATIASGPQESGSKNTVTLESPDSLEGVIGIYSQDLLNRYPNYTVTEKEIIKDDALGSKAIVLNCSGPKGNLTVTAWPAKNGLTSIEIEKDSSF